MKSKKVCYILWKKESNQLLSCKKTNGIERNEKETL